VQITQRTACLHLQRSMLSKPIQPHKIPYSELTNLNKKSQFTL
jgi:hypothetical protein